MRTSMVVKILFLGLIAAVCVTSVGTAQTVDPKSSRGIPKGFNLGSSLQQKGVVPDYDRERMKESNIKSLTIWQYEASPGKTPGEIIESDAVQLSSTTFTPEGYPLEAITHDQESGTEIKLTYVYDDSGYIQEASMTSAEEIMNQRVVYEYDAKKFLTGIRTITLGGTVTMNLEYIYDSTGRLIESSSELPAGPMRLRMVYEYDEEGQLISVITYDTVLGTILMRTEINYDADGWEVITYDAGGNVIERTRNINDSTGNIGEVVHYDSQDRIISKTTNTYDDVGNLVETVSSIPAADMQTRVTSTYDVDGNVIEAVSYNKLDEPVKVIKYAYEHYE